ncbi:hypothetical protein EYC80_009669 [Monilinia laxa]|uniref:Ketoreductase (KR) domain-containing protein n=1 Tax=Monilinia laxa TaxID=61186 RepID=A0A5N6JYR8_MONLA|nr:hypothetical protein EYC80_009669 [Monilinia laxa]
MTSLKPRNIIIIGAGPLMSRSLSLYLASHKWQIILISRKHPSLLSYAAEINTFHPEAPKVLVHTGDASIPSSLTEALNWAAEQVSGKVDVVCYNAAHVAPSPLLELQPETLVQDFNITATGTLVAGQWFMNHANTSHLDEGEHPLFLVPGGMLDRYPDPNISALCATKSANLSLRLGRSIIMRRGWSGFLRRFGCRREVMELREQMARISLIWMYYWENDGRIRELSMILKNIIEDVLKG